MTVLSVSDVTLSFGHRDILTGISFSIQAGDRVGVIGVNGAGKTSLCRLVTGEYEPTSGAVYLAKDTKVGMLRQNTRTEVPHDTTLLEYLYTAFPDLITLEEEIARVEKALSLATDDEESARLALRLADLHATYARDGGLEYKSRCRSMLSRMGFSDAMIDGYSETLSGGEHTRLALARLLAREPDVLLLDEPTNHLDIDALTWLEEYLKNYKKTLLVISHDRYFLDKVTTKTLILRYGGGKLYTGSYSRAKEQEAQDAASQDARHREQQKEIAHILRNIEFQRRCGQAHNFVTIRAKEKQLERMELVEQSRPDPRSIRLSFHVEEESAGNVIEARDLSFSYGTSPLIDHLSFLVRRGECVLFLGSNGCGKSTLMKLIHGVISPTSGVLELGYNIKIGYYDQENRGLTDTNTVLEELHNAYPDMTNTEVRSSLALFLFGADDVDKRVGSLSGGEKARLTLAKLVRQKVNLLVLDEPTNHLDIGSREALEAALASFPGTIVAVSHDRYFISRLATRIIELDAHAVGGKFDYALESYDDAYAAYMELRTDRKLPREEDAPPSLPTAGKAKYEAQKKETADRRNAQKRKERAARRVEVLETELAALEEELFGSAATDYVRAAAIETRKAEIEEELLALYEEIL